MHSHVFKDIDGKELDPFGSLIGRSSTKNKDGSKKKKNESIA